MIVALTGRVVARIRLAGIGVPAHSFPEVADRFAQPFPGVGEAIRNFREGMRGDSDSGKANPGDDAARKRDDR